MQVAYVIQYECALWQDVRRRINAVNLRGETVFTRLIAVRGLHALASVLNKSLIYSIAADGSTQIFEMDYFIIMVKIPPLKVGKYIPTLHVVTPPLSGSHTGKVMFDITGKDVFARKVLLVPLNPADVPNSWFLHQIELLNCWDERSGSKRAFRKLLWRVERMCSKSSNAALRY